MSICKALFTSMLALSVASMAPAAIIDFEVLRHDDKLQGLHGVTYSEDGFLLEAIGLNVDGFQTLGTLDESFPGSTAMINYNGDGVTRLSESTGKPFDLTGVALAEWHLEGVTNVEFVGVRTGGGTVNQTFTLDMDDNALLQNFTFTGFTNLTSVTWTQASPFHQFDNLVVTVVPEPAMLSLLGVAAACILRRRARS